MARAGAGAGAEIMAKVGVGAENKYFRLRNTAYSRIFCALFKALGLASLNHSVGAACHWSLVMLPVKSGEINPSSF